MRTTITAVATALLLAACASAPEQPAASSAGQPDAKVCKEDPRTGSNIVKRCSPASGG